jgi:hypothetical protein
MVLRAGRSVNAYVIAPDAFACLPGRKPDEEAAGRFAAYRCENAATYRYESQVAVSPI